MLQTEQTKIRIGPKNKIYVTINTEVPEPNLEKIESIIDSPKNNKAPGYSFRLSRVFQTCRTKLKATRNHFSYIDGRKPRKGLEHCYCLPDLQNKIITEGYLYQMPSIRFCQ